jgi:signal transduction histidine kinase/CheY-like chemotaxis protein
MIEFIAPGSVQTFQENFAEIREGGKILNGEIVFQRKNGTTYVGLVNVHGEFSPDGKFTGIRASVMDITERRSVEESLATSKEELSRANAELMRANRAKDDFLSGMSHEFRTPLTGVIGMAEALEMENLGSLNERQRQALSSLQTSARQLLELVNVTIDYSKLEANRLELVLEDCPILPILTQCMVAAGPVAAGKHQSLILQTGNEDLVIRADTRRVKQMIDQLISNAVKFTPENGSISIRFSADKDANQIAISVQDTGPGIPPEEMNRLYQPFSQLDAGLARKHSGLGLGLALTARLVDLHGGSIRAESAPGGGACFTLRLPLIMRQADSRQLVSGDARGVIAIADDNEAVLMSYADTLREQGFAVITSRNGLEMAHLVKTQRPDVILTDARMPGMDGLALIREIRNQKSAYFKQVPILVMTAYGIPDSRQHFLNAGAIAYFEKPVAVATLLEWIKPLSAARKPHAEK